jgi:hypothetical protein
MVDIARCGAAERRLNPCATPLSRSIDGWGGFVTYATRTNGVVSTTGEGARRGGGRAEVGGLRIGCTCWEVGRAFDDTGKDFSITMSGFETDVCGIGYGMWARHVSGRKL